MLSTIYTVAIAGISGSGDSAGFIDNMKVEQYMANNGAAPASFASSENKVRGNIRYKNLVEQLQIMGNMYLSNASAANATVDTTGGSFNFTLEVERGDETLITYDETANATPVTYGANTGNELLGANAIVRCVARALCESRPNYVYPVYDPTLTTAPANGTQSNTAVRIGSTTTTFNVASLSNSVTAAASSVTVTKIA
jgi:hypothetical protein